MGVRDHELVGERHLGRPGAVQLVAALAQVGVFARIAEVIAVVVPARRNEEQVREEEYARADLDGLDRIAAIGAAADDVVVDRQSGGEVVLESVDGQGDR